MDGFKKVRPTGEDLDRVIEKDDSNSSITTDHDTDANGSPRSCLDKTARIIDTNKFQICVVCAVALNGFLVVGGLLAAGDGYALAAAALHYASIGILTVFVIEVLVRIVALRREFFRRRAELFDVIVVGVTFALAIAFAREENIRSSAGLLVLLRLWRVAKILNGIIRSVRALADRRLQHERRTRAAVEQELAKFRAYCTAQEREIATLRAILRKHGLAAITDDSASMRATAAAATIRVIAEVNSSADVAALETGDIPYICDTEP